MIPRKTISSDFGLKDFRKKARSMIDIRGINKTRYNLVIWYFNEYLQKELLDSYFELEIPHNGSLRIQGEKIRKGSTDFPKSKKYNKRIRSYETHVYKTIWDSPINKKYKVQMCRNYELELLSRIKSRKFTYFTIN